MFEVGDPTSVIVYSSIVSGSAGVHGTDWRFQRLVSDDGVIIPSGIAVCCELDASFWQQGGASEIEANTACNRS